MPKNLGLLADRLPKPDYEDLPSEMPVPPRKNISEPNIDMKKYPNLIPTNND